jgi:hypothetical protein
VIAHAVSGNYSHAALVISENEIFEATTTGVGFRLPTMDFKRRPWSWYEGSNLGVLSHAVLPHLSHGRQEQLILEARKVCHRLSGKKYAPLADLISLGRRPWLVALQRRFLPFYEEQRTSFNGCSGSWKPSTLHPSGDGGFWNMWHLMK